MEGSAVVGGIFLQEPPQILVMQLRHVVHKAFDDLYNVCMTKAMPLDTFKRCMTLVETRWTDADFGEVESALTQEAVNVADIFGQSFILFVRLMHEDPSAQRQVSVRVSIPPLKVFVTRFIRHIAKNAYVVSGAYFAHDGNLLCQEHACMEAIRRALQECVADYVIIDDALAEPVAAGGEYGNASAEPEIEPEDSASNVSPSPRHAAAPSQLSKPPSIQNVMRSERKSTITSLEMADAPQKSEIGSAASSGQPS